MGASITSLVSITWPCVASCVASSWLSEATVTCSFTSRDANGKWTVRPLGVKGTHPVYSKSGDSIYFGRNDSAVEAILRVPAAGGAPVEIAKTHGLSFGLSADGRDLYFVHDLADTRLWKMSLATGSLTPLLDGLVPYCTSCWAASDTGVYYLGTDRSSVVGQAIFFHSFQRGPDRIVAQYPEVLPPLGSGPFSLSPDGRYLLCVRVDSPRAECASNRTGKIRSAPWREPPGLQSRLSSRLFEGREESN
jgi:hypothetical protein